MPYFNYVISVRDPCRTFLKLMITLVAAIYHTSNFQHNRLRPRSFVGLNDIATVHFNGEIKQEFLNFIQSFNTVELDDSLDAEEGTGLETKDVR